MGKVLFFGAAILIVIMILSQKGVKKLPWYFAGIMFFPVTINIWDAPPLSIPRLAIYSLLASIIFFHKNWYVEFKKFPIKTGLIAAFLTLMLIGVFSEVSVGMRLFLPFDLFIKHFLVLFLTYFLIESKEDFLYVVRTILKFFLVFCIYGFVNYITKENQYYSFISETFGAADIPNVFMTEIRRFRISSFAWHPIYYGLVLSISIFLCMHLLFFKQVKKGSKPFLFLILLLLIGNLFLTNSRTPLLAFLVGLSFLFLFALNWRLKLNLAFLAIIALSSYLFLFEHETNILEETFNTFTESGSELEGSSMEMRVKQMELSINEFQKSPIVGNGIGYIGRGLGYNPSDKNKSMSDDDFAGFESYSYKLLIEQGLAGIIGNLIYFFSLFAFFFKRGRLEKTDKISYVSISILIAFLLFIFGTGDMGAFIFCMSIIGLTIKYAQLIKLDKQNHDVLAGKYEDSFAIGAV